MAHTAQISSISTLHGKTARAVELAITIEMITNTLVETSVKTQIKTITPKTITKR